MTTPANWRLSRRLAAPLLVALLLAGPAALAKQRKAAQATPGGPASQPAQRQNPPSASAARAAASAAPRAAPATEQPRWLVPQLHAGGLLLASRVGASLLWPEAFDPCQLQANSQTFARSWTTPPELDPGAAFFEWDHDPWSLNLIGHGLLGSEIYLRQRQAAQPVWVSLALTLGWTVVWEYLIEAWHKQPSGIDLLWTPLGGLALGEGRYQLYRLIQARRPSAGRQLLLYLIDPLGQLERDLFGLSY